MTKEQLLALISAKVAGQGNQIDIGGVLPTILAEIIGMMAESGDLSHLATLLEVDDFEEFSESTAYNVGDIVRHEGALYRFIAEKDADDWDESKVDSTNVFTLLYEKLPVTAMVNISALQTADLTAEQASAVGFTPDVIRALQMADNPTIHFNDMCVTFNAVEVISDDLVNQSALIVHTAVGGGEIYKCILSLYTDGRIYYNVTALE